MSDPLPAISREDWFYPLEPFEKAVSPRAEDRKSGVQTGIFKKQSQQRVHGLADQRKDPKCETSGQKTEDLQQRKLDFAESVRGNQHFEEGKASFVPGWRERSRKFESVFYSN